MRKPKLSFLTLAVVVMLVPGCSLSFNPSIAIGGLDNSGSDPQQNAAPVGASFSRLVSYETPLPITLSATDAEGDALTYEIVDAPADGGLSGMPPQVVYTPNNGFSGADVFSYRARDATGVSVTAVVTITVSPDYLFYLSTSGDDGTAEMGNPGRPYRNAQAVADAILGLTLDASHGAQVAVGVGNFGNINVQSFNFGEHVIWNGENSVTSIIGNVSGKGADGANGADDGLGTPADGDHGQVGPDIYIRSNGLVRFGNIYSMGGDGGESFPVYDYSTSDGVYSGNGGEGGRVVVDAQSRVGDIDVSGGGSLEYEYGHGQGGDGGRVVMAGEADNIYANGAFGNFIGGDGGDVTVTGTALDIVVDGGAGDYNNARGGTITQSGQARNLYARAGEAMGGAYGNGGTVDVSGLVTGDVDASARTGSGSPTGNGSGGTVTLNETAVVLGDVWVDGAQGGTSSPGSNPSYADTSAGGRVHILSGARCGDVYARGGNAIDDINNYSYHGGSGGYILYSLTSTHGTLDVTSGTGNYSAGYADGAPGQLPTIP